MFIVLGHDESDKASIVACPIALIEDLFKILSFPLIDKFKVIVFLIKELAFHFVDLLFLTKDVIEND